MTFKAYMRRKRRNRERVFMVLNNGDIFDDLCAEGIRFTPRCKSKDYQSDEERLYVDGTIETEIQNSFFN